MTEPNCPICDKPAKQLIAQWFDYDTEDQYIEWICMDCAKLREKAQVKK